MQARYAVGWLVLWAIVVLVAAHTQAVFQQEHVFRAHFPSDVWYAWWSWLGV